MFMLVALIFLNKINSVTHLYSADKCPAMFIYKAVDNDERLANKYSITDSFGNTQTDVVDPEYVYLAPSAGSDCLVLDPTNPENIFVLNRVNPEKTLSFPGGFIENLLPMDSAAARLREKVKTKDGSEINLFGGNLGMAMLEHMTLDSTSIEGPFFGVYGHGDRAEGHVVTMVYHLIMNDSAATQLTANGDKIVSVHSCNILNLLKANIDQLVPKANQAGHFLAANPIDKKALGPCAYPFYIDHARILYKFYAALVNKGLLTKETGAKTDFATANPQYYKVVGRLMCLICIAMMIH